MLYVRKINKYEHVIVAERALGRALPVRAEVHHVNENKSDNRPQNLVICPDAAYHKLLHYRMRALAATGNANALKCRRCKIWGDSETITTRITPERRLQHEHPDCARKHAREVYRRAMERAGYVKGPYKKQETMCL